MSIIIGSIALLVIGSLVYKVWDDYDFIGFMIGSVGGLGLIISIVALFLNYIQVDAQLAHYEATKATIEDARNSDLNDNEYLMLSNKILEVNTFIAESKAYNDGVFALFIPDELVELEPLEFPK